MLKVTVILALGAVLVGGLAGSVGAGSYIPPPGDCCLQWSPNGTQILFTGNRGQGAAVGVVAPRNGPERFVPGIPIGLRSPDWRFVAYRPGGGDTLVVARVDGSDERVLGKSTGDVAWAPDSKRLAFVGFDGGLRVAAVDGRDPVGVTQPGTEPDWSPGGRRIAYSSGTSIHVVGADGSGDMNLTRRAPATRTKANGSPVWSPDGSRLAFWSSDGTTAFLAVLRIGGTPRLFCIAGAVTNGALVWTPDGRTIYGAGSAGLVGIELATGTRRTLAGIDNAVFSPDGSLIAFAAGGECRDRIGIYIADVRAKTRRRLTNSCSIYGTDGPDVLHGDFSQVLFGLGGNDTLYADDTYYFFDGNTLYGGPGNDRLFGGFGQDDLYGGSGDDVLDGGPSADVLVGGPGRDRIFGGGGGDTVYAADGQRDVISCGKHGYDRRDRVDADRIDVVAPDCELVHRR